MAARSNEIRAVGRRKSATARVRLRRGSGNVKVNGRPFEEYFTSETLRGYVCQPLALTGKKGDVDVAASIRGGGMVGQAGAFRHGIARALIEMEPELRGMLKESGMLTRDARVKERKKYGQPGARKKFQFSKR